jgi:hypothetical protein
MLQKIAAIVFGALLIAVACKPSQADEYLPVSLSPNGGCLGFSYSTDVCTIQTATSNGSAFCQQNSLGPCGGGGPDNGYLALSPNSINLVGLNFDGGGCIVQEPPFPSCFSFYLPSDFFLSIQVPSRTPGDLVAPTPIPGALPLFTTGLAALGLFGWRRKRKSTCATAAA